MTTALPRFPPVNCGQVQQRLPPQGRSASHWPLKVNFGKDFSRLSQKWPIRGTELRKFEMRQPRFHAFLRAIAAEYNGIFHPKVTKSRFPLGFLGYFPKVAHTWYRLLKGRRRDSRASTPPSGAIAAKYNGIFHPKVSKSHFRSGSVVCFPKVADTWYRS